MADIRPYNIMNCGKVVLVMRAGSAKRAVELARYLYPILKNVSLVAKEK